MSDDNSSWPKNVDRPPWQVAATGAYAAPFPEDAPAAPVVPPARDWPLIPAPAPDTELRARFEALKAAVKMAVRHYDTVGTDGIEGVLEGLKDALEEVGK